MQMRHRPYPFGLSWQDMQLDPSSISYSDHARELFDEFSGIMAEDPKSPAGMDEAELSMILDAAMAMAMKLVLDPDFSEYTRGQLLAMALDTALIWSRG
jgi:hypothetical protein